MDHDYYNLGYRDGFLGRHFQAPPERGSVGACFTKARYTFGFQDGRTAAAGEWRYADHDLALAIPLAA